MLTYWKFQVKKRFYKKGKHIINFPLYRYLLQLAKLSAERIFNEGTGICAGLIQKR